MRSSKRAPRPVSALGNSDFVWPDNKRFLSTAVSISKLVPFTKEEDALLISTLVKNRSLTWKQVAKALKGRDDTQCRDRWNKSIKKTTQWERAVAAQRKSTISVNVPADVPVDVPLHPSPSDEPIERFTFDDIVELGALTHLTQPFEAVLLSPDARNALPRMDFEAELGVDLGDKPSIELGDELECVESICSEPDTIVNLPSDVEPRSKFNLWIGSTLPFNRYKRGNKALSAVLHKSMTCIPLRPMHGADLVETARERFQLINSRMDVPPICRKADESTRKKLRTRVALVEATPVKMKPLEPEELVFNEQLVAFA